MGGMTTSQVETTQPRPDTGCLRELKCRCLICPAYSTWQTSAVLEPPAENRELTATTSPILMISAMTSSPCSAVSPIQTCLSREHYAPLDQDRDNEPILSSAAMVVAERVFEHAQRLPVNSGLNACRT